MQKIENFRDAALGQMKLNQIFRSATLDTATESDIEKIVKELKVKTIIDLRGHGESLKIDSKGHIHDHYEPKSVIKLDLVSALRNVIWSSLSLWHRLEYMIYRFFGWKSYAKQKALKNSVLGKEGLYGLNMGLLDHASEYLKMFFDEMTRDSYPVIVHCSAGKDRTGLTIAMLQSLCGVDREEIIESYSLSAKLLNKDRIVMEAGRMGLGPEFAESDPMTMRKTFEYIDAKYGSVQDYLESIGVSKQQQKEIIARLVQNSKM